jgi:hypothetical protein
MEELTIDALIAQIKDKDAKVRTRAWQSAGKVGAGALAPLAGVVKDGGLEMARAANQAMWQIVRYTGRPGAEDERKATVRALLALLGDDQWPVQLHRDVIWMLSEIINNGEIVPEGVAGFEKNAELREDVRAGLIRVPGDNATTVLKNALADAPEDFKPALACALRVRGVEVPEIPCPKLKGTKKTRVKPVQPKSK